MALEEKHPFGLQRLSVDYSSQGATAVGSAIDSSMSLLTRVRLSRPVISFAMGSPAADAIPSGAIADAIDRLFALPNPEIALDYSPTEGNPALREPLLNWLALNGQVIAPECILITAGGMQGLDLVYRLFVEPGDWIMAESPSYSNGLATARNHGAFVTQIPVDREGLDIAAASRAIDRAGRPPRLFYVIPTYQNPTGFSYTLERRQELLRLAHQTGSLVLEDDPYSELRYEGERLPSLLELDDRAGHVIQVRTFSKIIAPGLRVGWTIAPTHVVEQMVKIRQSMDTCANSLSQIVIADLITSGNLDRHIAKLKALYPKRRDAMDRSLKRAFGHVGGVNWLSPKGGMFIWLTLPQGVDGETLMTHGLQRGVAVVPGSAFDNALGLNAVRLCFTSNDNEVMGEGIERLGGALDEVLQSVGSP